MFIYETDDIGISKQAMNQKNFNVRTDNKYNVNQ